ncbi:MAG: carboxysome shell carbonic anhydrase [Gammaproteobacteria bacterium]|nr:carboxysome shell carbonic anhydrase [Gammaproteobacteria bacterium]
MGTAPRRRPGAISVETETSSADNQSIDTDKVKQNSATKNVIKRKSNVAIKRHQNILKNGDENTALYAYEQRHKDSFDQIMPVLKQISARQHDKDFVQQAQKIAKAELGFTFPEEILENAWVEQLDMKKLYAWSVFETYKMFCDDFYMNDSLRHPNEEQFESFIQSCGFHTIDISPCADGRLAHVIRYVLRLPITKVRRKSSAGALFDIEDSVQKWIKTEYLRYREGKPNTADEPTRYLKIVTYHFSSVDPQHEGCAAHGSDTLKAAYAGLERLQAFKAAIENGFCCGASIDLLLIGVDTDTDSLRIHIPDDDGNTNIAVYLDTFSLYQKYGKSSHLNEQYIEQQIVDLNSEVTDGMSRFIVYLVNNNLLQIDYVKKYFASSYADIGHAERFIGAGIGYEEIQLRNLMYFAYLQTVEEATNDLDVGIKIFTGLNLKKGLPVPIVVRFDHHSDIPGSRDRALIRCKQIMQSLQTRYQNLFEKENIYVLQVTRDCDRRDSIEIIDNSVVADLNGGAH